MQEQDSAVERALVSELLQVVRDYVDREPVNFAGSTKEVFPMDRSMTSRAHVRITEDASEFLDEYKGMDGFSSRELAMGAMVAYAIANYPEFREFVHEQRANRVKEEYSALWDKSPGAKTQESTESSDSSNKTEEKPKQHRQDDDYVPNDPPEMNTGGPQYEDQWPDEDMY